ncbi:MAG: N-acetyltransferase [Pseudomonadota bacterium]
MFRLLQEMPDDGPEVEWLLDLAFAPGRAALSSYQLRQGVAPIRELSTVARDEYDVLAGCIRYWPVEIGEKADHALLLGPIAVHPTRQGEGLGALLIMETLEIASGLGWNRVLLIGDEPYYKRFGFGRMTASNLDFPRPYNPERLLARELVPGAFDFCSGMVRRWSSKSTSD